MGAKYRSCKYKRGSHLKFVVEPRHIRVMSRKTSYAQNFDRVAVKVLHKSQEKFFEDLLPNHKSVDKIDKRLK